MDPNPPFEDFYKPLFHRQSSAFSDDTVIINELNLPLIDLRRLVSGDHRVDREECKAEIVNAAKEWGFFQVVNHGVTSGVLEEMRAEQARVFNEPFWKKQNDAFMNMSPGCYRWGTPTATSLRQLSWSEAFHIPLYEASSSSATLITPLSLAMRKFASTVSELALKMTAILAENLGQDSAFFEETCTPSSCYLRMNRYPACPNYSNVFGLMPHTDSDFLTVLHQDQVGGLQLVKDGRWIAIKPNPQALIINIGDLLQAWSNGIYKSVEHRVVSNQRVERLSTAFFLCPSCDTMIRSCKEPSVYRDFTFREYRKQVQDDVQAHGSKIGLSQFLKWSHY